MRNELYSSRLTDLSRISGVADALRANSIAFDQLNSLSRAREILGATSLLASQSSFQLIQEQINQRNLAMADIFRDFSSQKYISSLSQLSDQIASVSTIRPSVLASLEQITNSNRFSETLRLHSKLTEHYKALQDRADFTSALLSQSNAISQLRAARTLQSFKALTDLKNSPYAAFPEIDLPLSEVLEEDFDESIVEIDSEVKQELSTASDYEDLSEKAKKVLDYFYHHYILPLIIGILAAYAVIHAEEAKKELDQLNTPAEVKKFVRSPSSRIDKTALTGYRVTTAELLNFRSDPSMNSEVFAKLPVGTLVEIVDKSDRSWLLVEVEIDGEFEQGWISRRYTTYFR